jgi:hypothetical protein
MKVGEVVSVQMKARWAYSEIRSPRFRERYEDDARVSLLRGKLEIIPFESLLPIEITTLAEVFDDSRGCFLKHYWADVGDFVHEEWSAARLGRVYAMSELDPSGQGCYVPFATYAASPRPSGPISALDPRVAADKLPLGNMLRAPDPLIVGLYNHLQVLIDGYFRGLAFMRSASPSDRIEVLVAVPK